MTPWGPAPAAPRPHLLPPPDNHLTGGGGGAQLQRAGHWGPRVGSTATSNFDKHCARNGSEEQGSHSQDRAKQTNLGSPRISVSSPPSIRGTMATNWWNAAATHHQAASLDTRHAGHTDRTKAVNVPSRSFSPRSRPLLESSPC